MAPKARREGRRGGVYESVCACVYVLSRREGGHVCRCALFVDIAITQTVLSRTKWLQAEPVGLPLC